MAAKRKKPLRGRTGGSRGKVFVVSAHITRTLVSYKGRESTQQSFIHEFVEKLPNAATAGKRALEFMATHKPASPRDGLTVYIEPDRFDVPQILLQVNATRAPGSRSWSWNIDRSYIDGIKAAPRGVSDERFKHQIHEAREAARNKFNHDEYVTDENIATIPNNGMTEHALRKMRGMTRGSAMSTGSEKDRVVEEKLQAAAARLHRLSPGWKKPHAALEEALTAMYRAPTVAPTTMSGAWVYESLAAVGLALETRGRGSYSRFKLTPLGRKYIKAVVDHQVSVQHLTRYEND